MQTRLPPSIPPPSPVAPTAEEIGDDETLVHETSVFTDEEQEDATVGQGKLMNHGPLNAESSDASDPDRARRVQANSATEYR